MQKPSIKKFGKLFWGLVLVLLWLGIGLLFYRTHGNLTVEELLRYQPENRLLAVLTMSALFLLKSVDFVMPSAVLYTMDGIMFSLPAAILVNLFGSFIMSLVPYLIGRTFGPDVLSWTSDRFPQLREKEKPGGKQQFSFSLLLRCCQLPISTVGLYAGAMQYSPGCYLAGSMLGLLPNMLPYTFLGYGAGELNNPVFFAALVLEGSVMAASLLYYRKSRKKKSPDLREPADSV